MMTKYEYFPVQSSPMSEGVSLSLKVLRLHKLREVIMMDMSREQRRRFAEGITEVLSANYPIARFVYPHRLVRVLT
jgi:hypothetical protein